MAINKKLIHFQTKANFDNQLASGNILDTSICFIKDANLIWTHGNFYDGSSVDLSNIEASIQNILNNKQDNISDLDSIRSGALKGATSAQQFYNQTTLSKEGWYRIGLLTAVMSTSSARIVVGGTNADVSPIIMDFQHNFRGDMISQMPTVMTPLYITKVRAVKLTSDDVYVDLYFTNISSSLTTVSVFPLEGTWEPMNFVDVTASAGGTVATQIDIVQDGFLDWKVDKVEGKGLSTEDFTTALKTKLEGLNNYDATTIESAVSKLREDFNTLDELNAVLVDTGDAAFDPIFNDYVTSSDLSKVAISGSYNDLLDKPTISSTVTESTVSGWGFTKNTGTITGIKMNGASKGTSGVVDLGTVITAHQDISGKLDASVAAATYATKAEVPQDYLTEENVNEYIYAPIINHGTNDGSFALTANEYHVWGLMPSLALTLAEPSNPNIYNEYMFEFISGSTATTLSLPSTIKWVFDPDIQPNTIYQVSIVNNLGVIGGFNNE